MMQENNNFNTIISTWRRISADQGESVTVSMSGDSPVYQLNKKKDEEANLLVPEKIKGPIATAASAGAVTIISEAPNELVNDLEEKLVCREKEDSKEAAGDCNDSKEKTDTDYLENDEKSPASDYPEKVLPGVKKESTNQSSDKVDSAILQPGMKPPLSSAASNPEEKEKEDCFLVCLYYTLECCDCVLM